jgi:hypothetical protein
MEPEPRTQDPLADAASPALPAGLVWSARGFSCVFWGLPLGLALYFRAIEIRFVPMLRQVPPHLLGVVLVCTGAGMLAWARLPTSRWTPLSRQLLAAGALLLYLGPFVYWYSRLPPVGAYFLVNTGLLLATVIWLLYLVNLLAAEIGVLSRDRVLVAESRLSGWAALALTALPSLAGILVSTLLAHRYESTLLGEMRGLSEQIPFWIAMCLVIPLAVTMSSSWKAKERCLELLQAQANAHPSPGP